MLQIPSAQPPEVSPVTRATLRYVFTVSSFRLTANHDCSPHRCPDMLSPPLLASANPSLCPLPTIWSSLPTAAIQLSHPKLPQHYSIPDLLCFVDQCILCLFFILTVGKTPLLHTVMPLSSLHPHRCSHWPFSVSTSSLSPRWPYFIPPLLPTTPLLRCWTADPRFIFKWRVLVSVWNFKTPSTGF